MTNPVAEVRAFVRALSDVPSTGERRTSARQGAVLVVTLVLGTGSLAWSLQLRPGDPQFYAGTLLTALVWTGGAFAYDPARARRHVARPAPVVLAFTLGVLAVAVFVVAGVVVAQVPVLAGPVRQLLRFADAGSLPLVAGLTAVNGVAEELFFRGALYRGLTRHRPVLGTTVLYAGVTAVSGVPLLVLAAALVGLLTALLRRVTGGVVAPAITHVTWSLGMLLLLPRLLGSGG